MRRSGKTTRLIDEAIQALFSYGKIIVPTKYAPEKYPMRNKEVDPITFFDEDWTLTNGAQRHFVSRLLRRLEIEHNGSCEITKYTFYIVINTKDDTPKKEDM